MTNKEKKEWLSVKYPLTIIRDRYDGVYSRACWLAFPLDYDEIPEDVTGDDVVCSLFWKTYKEPVGKGAYANDAVIDLMERMEAPEFPEESEDERIRKAIIELLKEFGRDDTGIGENTKTMIAWLKKQKEQNGKDKKCADFTIYHPLKNGKGKYECIPYSFNGSLTSFSEDKDLVDFLRTCFYTKEECEEWIEMQKEQKPFKDCEQCPHYWDCPDSNERKSDTRTADDLQLLGFIYDLLASLEWSKDYAMSKDECLRRLNDYRPQKPDIEICPHSIKSKSYKESGYPIEDCDYGLEIALAILEKTMGEVRGYQTDDGIREHQTAIQAVKDVMKEQKPAEWSEEDKHNLNSVINLVHATTDGAWGSCIGDGIENWLKNLPERFVLQPKPEWSEEDKQVVDEIIGSLCDFRNLILESDSHWVSNPKLKDISREIVWLKSLRPQPKKSDYITPHKEFFKWIYDRLVNVHKENPNADYMISFKKRIEELAFDAPSWKPSKEQMDALRVTLEYMPDTFKPRCTLMTLQNDLEKLI